MFSITHVIHKLLIGSLLLINTRERVCIGIVVNVLDCDIVISEFEFHSRYYVHHRTNTLKKGMKAFIFPQIFVK